MKETTTVFANEDGQVTLTLRGMAAYEFDQVIQISFEVLESEMITLSLTYYENSTIVVTSFTINRPDFVCYESTEKGVE